MWQRKYTLLAQLTCILSFLVISCSSAKPEQIPPTEPVDDINTTIKKVALTPTITTGSERMDAYLPQLRDKKIGVTGNHSSLVNGKHLVDTLLAQGVEVKKIFSPEHGFRGTADAGERIESGKDVKTGLPVISLYGKNKKPTQEQLDGIELMIFDIQDVGARFYTYISTMHYVMEACAEKGIPVMILDRPNPNGYYVDGPVLREELKSFIGMHPVPVVHGMTVAEYAQMINEEGWLEKNHKCELILIPCLNYTHTSRYELPVPPSPNLKTVASIALYPSICFMEGTIVSVGRGTENPFTVLGYPQYPDTIFSFTPKPREGAKDPTYKNQRCYGLNLAPEAELLLQNGKVELKWLVDMYSKAPDKKKFFTSNSFDKLTGDKKIKEMLINGKSAQEMEAYWKPEVGSFKTTRKKYLLYPDFE
ncbi:MAG: exo-beta-N-acetylmuramidase NamZ domain-containing protein [Flavobacteriales bacterium]